MNALPDSCQAMPASEKFNVLVARNQFSGFLSIRFWAMRFVPRVPGAKEAMGMAAEKAISPDDLDNPASWGGGRAFH